MPVALITGASKGLGRALGVELARRGWSLVIDARGEPALLEAAAAMRAAAATTATSTAAADTPRSTATTPTSTAAADTPTIRALPGDVADEGHRAELLEAAATLGRLDLLVNNASTLGPSPLLELAEYPPSELRRLYEVNVFAPLFLTAAALEMLGEAPEPTVVNISSDAAVEHYESWGGYGSSKAALDHASATLAAERPALRVLSIDPGDMRTEMHQAAFPGEDISDRPEPEYVAPLVLAVLDSSVPSGRYRAAEFAENGARTALEQGVLS